MRTYQPHPHKPVFQLPSHELAVFRTQSRDCKNIKFHKNMIQTQQSRDSSKLK